MKPETRARRAAALQSEGLVDLHDLQALTTAYTGRDVCLETIRNWLDTGRCGVRLPSQMRGGRLVVKVVDAVAFYKTSRLLRDDIELARGDAEELSLPPAPVTETVEVTRQLDAIAIIRSRRERLAAAEAVSQNS